MPSIEAILFWVFASFALTAALAVVTCRSIIYSTLSLIVVFLSIAAFFVMNNADFLAIAQLIVYAVGLTIILLFGVMFTGEHLEQLDERSASTSQKWLFGIVCTLFGALLVAAMQYPFIQKAPSAQLVQTMQTQGSTALLGKAIFGPYALPFEMASVLLLIAMVGAILIAKKKLAMDDDATQRGTITRMPINLASAPKQDAEAEKQLVLSGAES